MSFCRLAETPALQGASVSVARGGDSGHYGAKRIREVDPSPLLGRNPRSGLRRGVVRRSARRHCSERERSSFRREQLGFVFKSANSSPNSRLQRTWRCRCC